MNQETLQAVSTYTAVVATLAAALSTIAAWLSYRLSQNIWNEMKFDEVIIPGDPSHPGLSNPDHNKAVIRCRLFNKSKRKAYLTLVEALDSRGNKIPITWSDRINQYGMPQDPAGLIGIVDSVDLYLRCDSGSEIAYALIKVHHSMSGQPLEVVWDSYETADVRSDPTQPK